MWKKLGEKIWGWRGILTTAPTVAGIAIALRLSGALQGLEWSALDQYFRWRPAEKRDERIVIVGINETDIQKYGWPIRDDLLAQLLEEIKTQQPRAIGLDLYRDLPVEPGHQKLVKIFESTPNLIGIEKTIGNKNSSAVAPAPALKKRGLVGANDVVEDADGKLRRGMLKLTSPEGKIVSSLGLRLAEIYLKAEGVTPQRADGYPKYILQLNGVIFPRFRSDDGAYVGADAGGYQILLNYRGPAQSFRTISLADILEKRYPDALRDRIVLIGSAATSLNDFFQTPYSINTTERTPGVEIQANLTSQILSTALDGRTLIQVWPEPVEWLWILLWSCIGTILSWKLRDVEGNSKRSLSWIFTSILLAGGSLLGASYLLFLGGVWIPVVPSFLTLIASATAIAAYVAYLEGEDRQTVMNLFGRHVSPKIAEAIWRDRQQLLTEGRLRGQQITATVLFTDLKGFSTVAEMLDPETLMSWLNEYMDAMSQIVLECGGVVDKFIGDAVMAVFGVPIPSTTDEAIARDAQQAVTCALAMGEKLRSLNQQWRSQGRPTVAMRVGIATGMVVTGSLGGSQRIEYTTIGDTVNVASRLESYDKSIDGGICRILINEETYYHIKGKYPTKNLGSFQLKGREQPTGIYQVMVENASDNDAISQKSAG